MAKTKHDLQGQTFGRLRVLSRAENSAKKEAQWNCVCDCGRMYVARAYLLVSGKIVSCGCRRFSVNLSHGLSKDPLYRIWVNMLSRCYNPQAKCFHNYGGRGITVCDRWRDSLQNFVDDMAPRPRGGTIERIDNNGDYCPENCRWATMLEQSNNKRTNVYVTIGNERKTVAEWCKTLNQPRAAIYRRISVHGMDPVTALLTPVRRRPRRA